MEKKGTDVLKWEFERQKQRRKCREYIFPKTCPDCNIPLDKWSKKIWKCRNCGSRIIPCVRIWN